MTKQRVHADDTSHQIRSDQITKKPDVTPADVTPADEEDLDDGIIAGLEHLMSMKDATAQKVKTEFLDHYASIKQAKQNNANWFRTIIHLKRNIHVDEHVYGLGLRKIRGNVIEFMEKPMSEVFILMLVLADMVMVIVEAVIDSVFDFSSGEGSRLLKGIGKDATCNIEDAYNIASSCRIVSITILSVFALELVVKFICAPRGFCKHCGHMLDFIVVGGSLVFEFTLHHSAGALLIFFRCWRGVRILHGLYEQIEYISKALETEAHLEHALSTVNKFKAFTKTDAQVRQQWKAFKHLKDSEQNTKESALRSTASPIILCNNFTAEEIDHPNPT